MSNKKKLFENGVIGVNDGVSYLGTINKDEAENLFKALCIIFPQITCKVCEFWNKDSRVVDNKTGLEYSICDKISTADNFYSSQSDFGCNLGKRRKGA